MPDPLPYVLALPLALVAVGWLLRSVRQVNQWEVALRFTLGKLSGRLEPGLQLVLPGLQRMVRIDTRIRNRDLPYQQVITQDNVTASIDAVIYYKVVDAERAVLNVENYETAVWDRAKVVLANLYAPDANKLKLVVNAKHVRQVIESDPAIYHEKAKSVLVFPSKLRLAVRETPEEARQKLGTARTEGA